VTNEEIIAVSERVYIVDAEDSVRRSLKRLLSSFSIEALTFASLAELVSAKPAASDRVCLIVDAETVGSETNLKETLNGYGQSSHVIVITTHDGDVARKLAKTLDAVICLQKPIDAQALIDSIRWGFAENG
jgi:FixJ family two-component response regulator